MDVAERAGLDFAAELRQAIMRAGRAGGAARARKSKSALAQRANISVSSLYAYLAGTTLPSSGVLDAVLIAAGVPAADRGRLATLRDNVEVSKGLHYPQPPRQLPLKAPVFVGRGSEVGSVEAILTSGDRQGPAVCAIVGMAGVGKTELALHIAHRVADKHFADGQLYVNLRGRHRPM